MAYHGMMSGNKAHLGKMGPEGWQDVWMRKLEKSIDAQKLADPQASTHRLTIETFLKKNPGPPAAIPESVVKTFIESAAPERKIETIESLIFFYKNVVGWDKHAGFLMSLREQAGMQSLSAGDRPEKKLPIRKYNRRKKDVSS
jgi:hypothetical protein